MRRAIVSVVVIMMGCGDGVALSTRAEPLVRTAPSEEADLDFVPSSTLVDELAAIDGDAELSAAERLSARYQLAERRLAGRLNPEAEDAENAARMDAFAAERRFITDESVSDADREELVRAIADGLAREETTEEDEYASAQTAEVLRIMGISDETIDGEVAR